MNPIKDLQSDHRRLNLAISRIQQHVLDPEHRYFAEGRRSEATEAVLRLVESLIADLEMHERRERESLYPLILRRRPELRDAYAEIELEHRGLEAAAAQLKRIVQGELAASNREIAKRVIHLLLMLKSHMRDEERHLFAPMENVLQEAL